MAAEQRRDRFIGAAEWHDGKLVGVDISGFGELEHGDVVRPPKPGATPIDSVADVRMALTRSAPVLIGPSARTANTVYSVNSWAIGVTSVYFRVPTWRTSLASKVGPLIAIEWPSPVSG